LTRHGNQVVVSDQAGTEIGRIEPKLERDLIRLLDLGSQYSVFVTAANEQAVHVIIRETHRSAALGSRPSFRPTAAQEVRAYTREGAPRYELEEEDDDDDELGDDDEEETEAVPADMDAGVEETPLEALAAEEDSEEST